MRPAGKRIADGLIIRRDVRRGRLFVVVRAIALVVSRILLILGFFFSIFIAGARFDAPDDIKAALRIDLLLTGCYAWIALFFFSIRGHKLKRAMLYSSLIAFVYFGFLAFMHCFQAYVRGDNPMTELLR